MTSARAALQEYATTFFGYGTWSAPFWFIGMEEGGAASLDLLDARVNAWLAEGRPELVDLARHHHRLGGKDWFAENAPLQSTWRPLIRVVLAANGIEPTPDLVRNYQRTRLGREDGETALLELMPFPSPRTSVWPYDELGWSRHAYRQALEPERRRRHEDKIKQYQPNVVVFYGQCAYWRAHFPINGHLGATRLIAMRHPTARGTKNDEWDELGRSLRS